MGKTWSLEEARNVIIVSSTTGEGEQPENVIKFWRKLRPKTLSADFLSSLRFAQLGLGDTNYNEFCAAPKALHRRLTELGASCVYGPAWADDGTGLEVVVEPWLDGLWEAVDNMTTSQQERLTADIGNIKLSDGGAGYTLPACPKRYLTIRYVEDQPELTIKDLYLSYVAGKEEGSAVSITKSNVKELFQNYLEKSGEAELETVNYPSMRSPPQQSTVIASELISRPNKEKSVKEYYQVTLSSAIEYQVGDTIGVLCHNRPEEVDLIKNRLTDADSKSWTKPCQVTLSTEASAKAKQPPHLPLGVTSLLKIFSSAVDVRAVPKKLLLRALLEFTDSDEDRQLLTVLASKEGGAEYTAKVREPQLSLLDLLALVPSCRPPASLLLEHLPRLLPRPYSLSSSPSDSPGEISWIFTRVTEPRPGLATSWLSGLQAGSLLSVYPRSSHGFSPPEDLSADYIMVAAGSGIGPFIGFLKDRLARRERGDTVTGRCWLVFGCRYSDGDFLKKEFINQLKQSNLLSKLNVSFSREKLGGPKYVQDSLKLERETLFEWLHQNDATFYICGDAKGMATDVKKTVNEILSEKLGTESGAEFFKKLVAEKRYREDIWS